jgi:hypothetical protein
MEYAINPELEKSLVETAVAFAKAPETSILSGLPLTSLTSSADSIYRLQLDDLRVTM